jgi:hypothetical protein
MWILFPFLDLSIREKGYAEAFAVLVQNNKIVAECIVARRSILRCFIVREGFPDVFSERIPLIVQSGSVGGARSCAVQRRYRPFRNKTILLEGGTGFRGEGAGIIGVGYGRRRRGH